MNTADMLRQTKENLLMEGWCQGTYEDRSGGTLLTKARTDGANPCGTKRCLLGHLRSVAGYEPGREIYVRNAPDSTFREALVALELSMPEKNDPEWTTWCNAWTSSVEGFAEHDDTTLGDICALIDRAVSLLSPPDPCFSELVEAEAEELAA